jgi:hypothetical protein
VCAHQQTHTHETHETKVQEVSIVAQVLDLPLVTTVTEIFFNFFQTDIETRGVSLIALLREVRRTGGNWQFILCLVWRSG